MGKNTLRLFADGFGDVVFPTENKEKFIPPNEEETIETIIDVLIETYGQPDQEYSEWKERILNAKYTHTKALHVIFAFKDHDMMSHGLNALDKRFGNEGDDRLTNNVKYFCSITNIVNAQHRTWRKKSS